MAAFTETKLRMLMIKYDFISVFELVWAKWMHIDSTVECVHERLIRYILKLHLFLLKQALYDR